MRRFRLLALCFLPIASAVAQQAPPSGFSGVEGIVVDSLRGGFLREATVSVSGTSRFAFTDSLGRYRIDSIPPGPHQLELFHEILDTLAIRIFTPQLAFVRDSVTFMILGIPAPQTIIRAKCAANAEDPAALLGMALDAESEEPVAGAEIRLSWVELVVGRETGLRYEPKSRSTTTDASGRYKVCALPSGLTAELSAKRGNDSTGTVQLSYGESLLGMATILLPAGRTPGAPAPTTPVAESLVRGVVVDSAGRPVAGARVLLAVSGQSILTDSAGRFALSSQRAGTQPLVIRRLGFRPIEMVVNLTSRRPSDVTVHLDLYVPVLEAVLIDGRRAFALDRVGFSRRQRMGTGRYVTQQDIDRRNPFRLSDLMTTMPGFRVFNDTVSFRNRCVKYWVDGFEWRGGTPDDFVNPNEVGAMEVYSNNFVPAEFQSFDGCAAIVIWTKWKLGVR